MTIELADEMTLDHFLQMAKGMRASVWHRLLIVCDFSDEPITDEHSNSYRAVRIYRKQREYNSRPLLTRSSLAE